MEIKQEYCTSCGAEMKADAKFCTSCGAKKTSLASSQQSEVGVENFKAWALKFWEWFLSALKKPYNKKSTDSYWYGGIILILTSILTSLTFARLAMNIEKSVSSTLNPFTQNTTWGSASKSFLTAADTTTSNTVGHLVLPMIIGFLVMNIGIFLAGWISNRGVLGNKTFDFKYTVNFYGRLYVPLCSLSLVGLILSLVKANSLAVLVMLLSLTFLTFITVFGVFKTTSDRNLDVFWLRLLVWLANGAIITFFIYIGLNIIGREVFSLLINS